MAMLEPNAGYHTGQREGAAKRNPLLDLIDSEKIYVEQLGLVIRVSSQSTSSNLFDILCHDPLLSAALLARSSSC
jgi:hypothetical protein